MQQQEQPHSIDELCQVLQRHGLDYSLWEDGVLDDLWGEIERGARLSVDRNGHLRCHDVSVDVRVVFSERPRAKKRLRLWYGNATPYTGTCPMVLVNSLRTRRQQGEKADDTVRRLVRAALQVELRDDQIKATGGMSQPKLHAAMPTTEHMGWYEVRLTEAQYQDFYVQHPPQGETFVCFFWLHE